IILEHVISQPRGGVLRDSDCAIGRDGESQKTNTGIKAVGLRAPVAAHASLNKPSAVRLSRPYLSVPTVVQQCVPHGTSYGEHLIRIIDTVGRQRRGGSLLGNRLRCKRQG